MESDVSRRRFPSAKLLVSPLTFIGDFRRATALCRPLQSPRYSLVPRQRLFPFDGCSEAPLVFASRTNVCHACVKQRKNATSGIEISTSHRLKPAPFNAPFLTPRSHPSSRNDDLAGCSFSRTKGAFSFSFAIPSRPRCSRANSKNSRSARAFLPRI